MILIMSNPESEQHLGSRTLFLFVCLSLQTGRQPFRLRPPLADHMMLLLQRGQLALELGHLLLRPLTLDLA